MTTLLVPKEREGERRVSATPETIKQLIKAGLSVHVEAGAGAGAALADHAYVEAGATIVEGTDGWASADIIAHVSPLSEEEAGRVKAGALVVSLMNPDQNLKAVARLQSQGASVIAMELIPRITRAQSMDVLSSQSNLAGYKAVLVGAARSPRLFPLMMTAAGTVRPANVVIMGAGVAGLQAIATAKRLGAIVEVSDIRPETKEQVESLGGKFIELPDTESGSGEGGYAKAVGEEFLRKQRAIVAERLKKADLVVTTALVPGRPAPNLIDETMVSNMKPGAVIVDLAAARGGNCSLTKADEEVEESGVLILGPTDLPSQMSVDASQLYARNLRALLDIVIEEGAVKLNLEDEIIDGALLVHDNTVRHAPTAELLAKGDA